MRLSKRSNSQPPLAKVQEQIDRAVEGRLVVMAKSLGQHATRGVVRWDGNFVPGTLLLRSLAVNQPVKQFWKLDGFSGRAH